MGSFLGLAVGDALGAPLEGLSPPSKKITRMVGGGVHNLQTGQCTDDTLQAAALARSLITCRGLDIDDLLPRLVHGYCQHPECYGPTSSATFEALAAGSALQAAPSGMGRSAAVGRTNGSIMRGVPLGVYYPPLRVRTPSLLCSWITHRNPVAGECSTFINLMISHLCRGAEKQGAFQKALDSCENPELHHIMAGYDLHPLTPSMDAVWTTHCAVRIVLESQDYYDALITAVNLGGDADTIGAVSGALAGAVWGLGSIPQDWLLSLIDLPALRLLAQELVTVAYD